MTHFERADTTYLTLLTLDPKRAIEYLAEQFSQVVMAERERMRNRTRQSIPVAQPVERMAR